MAEIRPIEQTVFEQAPQATFVPPAQQPQVYQEDKVVFMEPIYSVDPGIAWDALGAEAAKTASTMFANTLDYLIGSKRNALAELKDKYEAQLNDTYIQLSSNEQLAKSTGVATPTNITDGLIQKAAEIRSSWKTEADVVLENNKSVFFQPAINYWDENLDIKSLGSKYQELAVAARASDRDITRTTQKLIFDGQLANVFGSKQKEKVAQAKQGYRPGDPKDNNTKVTSGVYPLAANKADLPPNLFHDIDPTTNQRTVRQIAGEPLIVENQNGSVSMNPNLDVQTVLTALNPEEFKYVNAMEQDQYEDSYYISNNGQLAPEVSEWVKAYFDVDRANRDEGYSWKVGYLLSQVPVSTVDAIAREKNLNATDSMELNILVADVRNGARATDIGKIKGIEYRDMQDAVAIYTTLSDLTIGGGNIQAKGISATQAVALSNSVIAPIVGSILGLSQDEQEDLFIKEQGNGLIADVSHSETLGNIIANNQSLAPVVVKAIAYFKSNPQLMYDEDGTLRRLPQIQEAVNQFIKSEVNRTGLVVTRNPKTNQVTSFYNPDLIWFNEAQSKHQQDLLPAYLSLPESTFIPATRQNSKQEMLRLATQQAEAMVGRGQLNRTVFAALYNSAAMAVQEQDQSFVSRPLPPAELMRMAVAASLPAMQEYGLSIEDLADNEKMEQMALRIFEDTLPATEWDIELDVESSRYMSYSQSKTGGIPLSIRSMKTKSGKDLMRIVPSAAKSNGRFTPEIEPGVPAFAIRPIKDEDSKKTVYDRLNKAVVAKRSGTSMYNLVPSENAPASITLQFDDINNSVTEFVSIPEVTQAFAYSENDPILPYTDAERGYNFIVVNLDTIKDIAKKDTALNKGVGLLLDDLNKAEKDRTLFTKENVNKMFLRAKDELGIKTNADFVSYVLSVAQAKVANKETNTGWNKALAKRVGYNLGLDKPIQPNTFMVESNNPDYNGTLLYSPASKQFYTGIKEANKTDSFDLYLKAGEPDGYMLVKAGTQLDPEDFQLIVAGRGVEETPEDYNNRFAQQFGVAERALDSTMRIRDGVRKALPQVPTEPIISKIHKPFVLPSDMMADFKKQLNIFTKANGNSSDAWMMPLYDFSRLYFETGSIPATMADLPAKYALPGHPKFNTDVKPSITSEIARGLGDAATALFNLPSEIAKVGETLDAPRQQYIQEETKKARQFKVNEALQRNDMNYYFSSMFADPVATLRLQHSTTASNYNQNFMNVVNLAFDGSSESEVMKQPDTFGVTPEIYRIAADFKRAGWTAAGFEYQVQQNLGAAYPKGKVGSLEKIPDRNLNLVISSLSPDRFDMDEKLKTQILTDVRSYMERTGGFNVDVYKKVLATVNDPTKGIKTKQEYLLATLLPGARTLNGSRDMTRIRGVAEKMIRDFE